MVAGLTNGAGKIINKVSRPVNKAWDPAELCRQSAQLAQQAAEVGGFAADQIKAVGLGLPGLVDNKTGYVIQTPNMHFDNTPIREMFQAEWDVPVYLGNDANCAAIGEYSRAGDMQLLLNCPLARERFFRRGEHGVRLGRANGIYR